MSGQITGNLSLYIEWFHFFKKMETGGEQNEFDEQKTPHDDNFSRFSTDGWISMFMNDVHFYESFNRSGIQDE